MEINQDGSEVQKTTEEVAAETTIETPEELTIDQIAELKKKADVSSQNFERAKKAEWELKEARERLKSGEHSQTLSPKDYLALTEAGVSSEDFDEVERVSKILNKPLMETLKDKTMKSILLERSEERKSAIATQTSGGQRGPNKATGEALLERASKGDLPEGAEDIAKLVKAKLGIK